MTDEPVPVAAPRVVSLYNPANMLTAVRIVLVPVFAVLVVVSELASSGWRIAACLAFCVASATDFVDGWIARRITRRHGGRTVVCSTPQISPSTRRLR